jgi:SAM-dependent methyltransferase
VSRSEDLSREFYLRLGAERLALRTRPEWDAQIVAALAELLPPAARVLDVGCGYGRIALPLARRGYHVDGIDLAPNLVDAARAAAEDEGVDIRFTVGSMVELPYPDESFDATLCLWSAFNELIDADEQAAALAEMWRVTAPGGFALLEGGRYTDPTEEELRNGVRRGPEHREDWNLVEGLVNPHYRHDERSFARLCRAAGIGDFAVFEREWGGRERLFLRVGKAAYREPPAAPSGIPQRRKVGQIQSSSRRSR